jgi:hypothetical protein
METLRGFGSYWWENLRLAHERREIAMIIIGAGGLLFTFVAYVFGFSSDPRYAAWAGIVSGLVLVAGLLWSPFQQREKLIQTHAAAVADLTGRHAAEIARLTAELTDLKIRWGAEVADLKARLDRREKHKQAMHELGGLQLDWDGLLNEILKTPDDHFDDAKTTAKIQSQFDRIVAFLESEFGLAEAAAFWSTADMKLTSPAFWPRPQQYAIDHVRHYSIQLKKVIERQSTAQS